MGGTFDEQRGGEHRDPRRRQDPERPVAPVGPQVTGPGRLGVGGAAEAEPDVRAVEQEARDHEEDRDAHVHPGEQARPRAVQRVAAAEADVGRQHQQRADDPQAVEGHEPGRPALEHGRRVVGGGAFVTPR
ncbi:hypothetical protein ADJ73_04565 [Arsenicicoccus sp. oral taxon 190]|nr:hypothetical protein ADJ73_04565 [Arsenicicoccus sp. oral taxon 190]